MLRAWKCAARLPRAQDAGWASTSSVTVAERGEKARDGVKDRQIRHNDDAPGRHRHAMDNGLRPRPIEIQRRMYSAHAIGEEDCPDGSRSQSKGDDRCARADGIVTMRTLPPPRRPPD